ncbi:beta-glucosidase family protein [Streptacidiphilus fuscans]|uniref:Glycoside hydrolase family 3 protein n=1 Tax=Streptacidiphilus fuscans TaxID=2789292 RepID=A0A931B0W8_9ACTN|nr:glycoside hydrolase family 3 protein [Streptacidiphilus fuscans]MBF9069044.1 glycoside hydrolase family 3 protein [Streptacidiphilus fuscans]
MPDATSAADLTLAEQASLTSGATMWTTTPVRGVLRALTLSDGPHGIRRQRGDAGDPLGLTGSVPATCFPPAVTLGSSWDPELVRRVGAALAREASVLGVDVVLGPGVNLKRSPLCGRNFEYFSEDPRVSGVMGAALVDGIQSLGVGACVKHFAVNNQETDRMRVSAEVDEQTLRELYLPAFEHIVREAKPYTVMCAYNKVNGVYASQHHWLLTQVLREEWQFDGLVMSDWTAVNDRVAALAAGLDLEMPPTGTDDEILTAVADGRLDAETVATAADRLLRLRDRVDRAERFEDWDADAHHELAREAARCGAVLLKNDGGLLPLDPTARQHIAVIGEFARTPRYQGHGSSHVEPTRLDSAWDALQAAFGSDARLRFAPGFTPDGCPAPELAAQAVAAAAEADVVLLFLGLPESAETEGADRKDIDLPAEQVALLHAVADANPQVAVVLANGGVVSVAEWQDRAQAVLEGWLGGQAGGAALADLLLGVHSPSGKLTESIPLRLADVPSHLYFPGGDGRVVHGEGRYVGYRHYDTLDRPVAYPFGHGLSYTTFAYGELTVTETGRNAWTVEATITNTGDRSAHETAQLYVAFDEPHPTRPRHELRGFARIGLEPGESGQVRFALTERDLAHWSTARGGWRVDAGAFTVEVGASSRDIRLTAELSTPGDGVVDALDAMSTAGEWLNHPVGSVLLQKALAESPAGAFLAQADPVQLALGLGVPLVKLAALGMGVTREGIEAMVEAARAGSLPAEPA